MKKAKGSTEEQLSFRLPPHHSKPFPMQNLQSRKVVQFDEWKNKKQEESNNKTWNSVLNDAQKIEW